MKLIEEDVTYYCIYCDKQLEANEVKINSLEETFCLNCEAEVSKIDERRSQ